MPVNRRGAKAQRDREVVAYRLFAAGGGVCLAPQAHSRCGVATSQALSGLCASAVQRAPFDALKEPEKGREVRLANLNLSAYGRPARMATA
jgi:hypothetical protein